MVMPRPEPFAFAEERRLLYVALTRTRNVVYSISNARSPSSFLTELVSDWKESGELQLAYRGAAGPAGEPQLWCPACRIGILRVRQGQYGKFRGCSRFPECTHTENVR